MFLFSALFVGEDLEIAGISVRILEEISRESCNFGRNFFFFLYEKLIGWNKILNFYFGIQLEM